MSAEDNTTIARRFFAEQDRGKGVIPEDLCAADYTMHVPGFPPMDRAGHMELGKAFYGAFPDLTQTVEDVFADEAKAAVRFTARGTHQGELMGMPPTGKPVAISGIAILQIVDGKVAAFHELFDQMGMLQQIGAMPAA
jgi:steroid delta-isomerase-like uncharacterized protein